MTNKNSYIVLFLLLLIGFSPLLSQAINLGITIILSIILLLSLKSINKKKLLLLMLFTFLIIVNITQDIINYSSISILNIYYFFTFLLGMLISEKYNYFEFLKKIEKVIFLLSLLSLISVLIYTFIPQSINVLPSYNYYETSHKTIFISNILVSENNFLQRNTGITWEPGAYQFILNIGLFAYFKTNKQKKLLHILIYLVTIMSTLSTTGLIILSLNLIYNFYGNKKFRIGIYILIVILFIPLTEIIEQQVNLKFSSDYLMMRFNPLFNSFQKNYFLFLGNGNVGFKENYLTMYSAPWDSFGQIFSRFGYIFLITIISLLVRLSKKGWILSVIFILTFSTENIWFLPFVTVFYFYSIERGLSNEKSIMVN